MEWQAQAFSQKQSPAVPGFSGNGEGLLFALSQVNIHHGLLNIGHGDGADLGMPATKCSAKFLAGQATGFLTSASACAFTTSKPTVANQL